MHSRKVVDFLMMFHFHEGLGQDVPVGPPEIPFWVLLIFLSFKFELFTDFGENIVNAVYLK